MYAKETRGYAAGFCYHVAMFQLAPFAFFALGAIIASFIGVLVARLNTGQGFLTGRSRCDACNAPLKPLFLIPIISYFTMGGRARCCGASLTPYAPITEFLLGFLFALAYNTIGFSVALPCMLISISVLLALVMYDLAHQILPTALLIIFIIGSALTGFFLAGSASMFYDTIPVAVLVAFFLALIHFLSRGRAMGLADAPLAFGLALMSGTAALSGFIFSFWIGAVIGIIMLAQRPQGSRMGVEVPLAPFLAAGFLLAYFTQWNPFTLIAALS